MKKLTNYLIVGIISLISLSSCGPTKAVNNKKDFTQQNPINVVDKVENVDLESEVNENKTPDSGIISSDSTVALEKLTNHLIKNKDGSYGGTLNRSKYGTGAPYNGEYDVKDSPYYSVNDFYNMSSTSQKVIYSKFAGYQQTMQDSSALACLLAAFNYTNEAAAEYSELDLVQLYEKENKTTVFRNGTTVEGLSKLLTSLGYTPTSNDFVTSGSSRQEYVRAFKEWIYPKLSKGEMVLVRYHDNKDYRFRLIIGYDTMGTDDWFTDDVVIFMDPNDGFDHNQDGYSTEAAGRFERWWKFVETSGAVSATYETISFMPKNPVVPIVSEIDPYEITPENIPDIHLILNSDGSYGGTTDASKYGSGTPLNGQYDHTDRNYYKFADIYNFTNTETRYILPNYRGFQQTMASTCGICSTFTVLSYYGEDTSIYNELWLMEKYEELTGKIIYNSGVGGSGLEDLVEYIGYQGSYDSFAKSSYKSISDTCFSSYEIFTKFVKMNLSKGTPMPISWRPHGGHWEVIIGYDDMGTDYIYDDVLVLADSGDSWDHYQDGYNIIPATLFFRQWYNGSYTYNQQYVYFPKQSKK